MTDLADALRPIVAELVRELLVERPPATDAPDRLYRVEEAAALLGIGRTEAYAMIAVGRLRSVRIGRRRLVAASDVAAFVARVKAERDQ